MLLEQIRDLGVDISSGKLSHILTEDLDDFHTEKDELLRTGSSVSQYIHTDDTGARHKGENGYCTHMVLSQA
ncbi:Mobile element protein [methanotrophic endosymbiont of Bathymodiolus azoricus (Menez Gwen)]|nr:Mobile element protein [methanotrophic endosymbiont of Bathymodiolus azoricus (Menez Gwen)]